MEYLIVGLVFYVGAVLITRALRRRSGVPTEPKPPQPATDRQRGYLSGLQRDKPGAASVLADLGITDVWDEALTLERASEAIDRIIGKEGSEHVD